MPPKIATVISLIILSAAAMPGCATTLEPAPEALRVPGVGQAARAEDAGIEVVASAEAWRGFPPDLDDVVTPMLVTITNEGDRPLELRYEHLALVAPDGRRFAALPPFQVEGIVYAPTTMVYPPMGFGLAPYLSPWYPGWSVWGGPFPYHMSYYDMYYPAFERVAMPSGDMVQKALPEGVLGPGGRLTGFIYFEPVEHVRRLEFVADLVDAKTDELFGTVEIPFVAD